jgi:hypothetical protein
VWASANPGSPWVTSSLSSSHFLSRKRLDNSLSVLQSTGVYLYTSHQAKATRVTLPKHAKGSPCYQPGVNNMAPGGHPSIGGKGVKYSAPNGKPGVALGKKRHRYAEIYIHGVTSLVLTRTRPGSLCRTTFAQ